MVIFHFFPCNLPGIWGDSPAETELGCRNWTVILGISRWLSGWGWHGFVALFAGYISLKKHYFLQPMWYSGFLWFSGLGMAMWLASWGFHFWTIPIALRKSTVDFPCGWRGDFTSRLRYLGRRRHRCWAAATWEGCQRWSRDIERKGGSMMFYST